MNNNYYGYIYLTTNIINDKKYIGQHKGKFNSNYLGSGVYIRRAIKKYKKYNFTVELLETANSLEELNELEVKYINLYNTNNLNVGYNIALGGSGSPGVKQNEYSKKLKSKKSKQLWKSDEFANRVKDGMHEYWKNEEAHIKASKNTSGKNNPMFGKTGSNSPCFGRTGVKHPMWGKHHTEEAKKKISKASKQMFIDRPELKEMLSKIHKGNTYNTGRKTSEETKKKLSLAGKGKKKTKEHKKKIGEALKGKFCGVKSSKSKSVVCLNKDDLTLVRIYEYVREVDNYGFRHSAVCSCCKYRSIKHGNFIWLYKDVYDAIKKEDNSVDINVWKKLYENVVNK